ncbi:MAG: DinB family protein [Candidatus Heimdallarchaeota archaeon]
MQNRKLVDLLAREMDDAWDTLQQALDGLTEEEFWWKPSKNAWTLRKINDRWSLDYDKPTPIPKGPLTVAWLVVHIAACKVMYVEYAVQKGKLTWDDLILPSDRNGALAYLKQSHHPLRAILDGLTDEDLPKLRETNWGELWPTERIIWTMIHHDIYHGAQIQSARKIFQSQKSS